MFEREYRDLAWVPRWTIIRTLRTQSVAEHSYYVALYAAQIAELTGWGGPRDQLMYYALTHDLEEILSGDISSPAKRSMKAAMGGNLEDHDDWVLRKLQDRFPYLPEPDEKWDRDILNIVKLADLIEAAMFLRDEMFAGNQNVMGVVEDIDKYLFSALRNSKSWSWMNVEAVEKLTYAVEEALNSAVVEPSKVVT